jgi:hypothetical protein
MVALRHDPLPPLPHGAQHVSGARVRCGHGLPPFHGYRLPRAWPLLCDGGMHVHDAPPLFRGVLRFVYSSEGIKDNWVRGVLRDYRTSRLRSR